MNLKMPENAIKNAEGIFTGGGNTFLLVTQLYKQNIMQTPSETVKNGTPYLGTSAGSNICGLSMQTTNDMPIIYPPSFQTLGLIPFNLKSTLFRSRFTIQTYGRNTRNKNQRISCF